MIKLLIVDDESIIRKGIRYYIDWASNGIEVVGEASNGEIGLKQTIALMPDIIVSDIRMPLMDGIKMSQEIKKLYPQIKIILLTGYNDKEYLLSAIKFNAFDFVMKSANPDSILQAVKKARDAILSETKEKNLQTESIQFLEQHYRILKQELLRNILTNKLSERELQTQMNLLDIKLTGSSFSLVFIEATNYEYNSLIAKVMYLLGCSHSFFDVLYEKELWGIVCVQDGEQILDVLSVLKQCNHDEKSIKILYSPTTQMLKNISGYYTKMISHAQRLCWLEKKSVTKLCEPISFPSLPLDILLRLESELLASFTDHQYLLYQEQLEQYFKIARNYALELPMLKESVKRILVPMYRSLNHYERAETALANIDETYDVAVIFQILSDMLVPKKEQTQINPIVLQALTYLQDHYTKPIHLSQIATHCYVSSAYLSRLFKDSMSVGVIEYLRNLRIKKACELLKTSTQQIQQIAVAVGYPDYKRFSLCFSQIIGMSPRKYRQLGCPKTNTIRDGT